MRQLRMRTVNAEQHVTRWERLLYQMAVANSYDTMYSVTFFLAKGLFLRVYEEQSKSFAIQYDRLNVDKF